MNEGKATRYHRLRRRAQVLATVGVVLALAAMLVSGASAAIRDMAIRIVDRTVVPSGVEEAGVAAVYTACVWLLLELLLFPARVFRGYVLERRYDLSRIGFGHWCSAHLTTTGLGALVAVSAAVVISTALRLFPSTWWLVCAAVFAVGSMALTALAPLIVFPVIYRVSALPGDGHGLRLASLVKRAGIRSLPIYQCAVGGTTRRAQATLVGLGPTRRVLVSDTLLEDCSAGEIDAVIAHELGHHLHRDVWQLVGFEFAVAVLALRAAGWAVEYVAPALALGWGSDVAALPLLALTAGAVVAAAAPLGHALSRYQERRADQFAIALTLDPASLVSGLRRLGAQHLAEERPSRLVELLWHTHPPLDRRLAAARVQPTGDAAPVVQIATPLR